MPSRTEPADLARHLSAQYDVDVAAVHECDRGVFRIDRRDGPSWVARVFADRDLDTVSADAAMLKSLESAGFPAERCAVDQPVSQLAGSSVLITEWVEGERANGRGRTYGVLGALLGRLHSAPTVSSRPGGAWHHLSQSGGPRQEIDAAIALFGANEARVAPGQQRSYDDILEALYHLDDGHDLPEAFVHPDFVPANAITTPDDRRIVIDWTGAGRGPRLWSLAFLLWAGGMRDLRLVDAAITRYARGTTLLPAELERLPAVIPGRALTIDVWSFCTGRLALTAVAARHVSNVEAASAIADRVRRTLLS